MKKLKLNSSILKITLGLALFIGAFYFLLPQQAKAVAGGQEAVPGQFPFAVRTNGCGGSLISSQWVITAEHCFSGYHNPSNNTLSFTIDVNVGGHYDSGRDGTQYRVVNAYKAPSVNGVAVDIMLLKLDRPVHFTDRVQPISYNNDQAFAASGTATVMGWGANCWDCPPSQVLRYYETGINSRQGTLLQLGSASNTQNGLCPQDSGTSAVKRNSNGRYILLGPHSDALCNSEVSWAADVSLVADWIYQVTGVAGNANSGVVSSPAPAPASNTNNSSQGCVIPTSGPWPPCATGAESRPQDRAGCIIPPSGPWPQCAR